MGPSCSDKPGQITNLAKTCSSFNFKYTLLHTDLMRSRYLITTTSSRLTSVSLVCTILHDVSNNSLPANISNLFLYSTLVHSYNTRFSETGSFNIKYSRTNQLKHPFSIFGARTWNSNPQSIRILPKQKFKVSLHQLLLRILELEDTYVDTPSLVNKLSKMKLCMFYHAKPHPHGFHCEAWRGKTKLFWSPGTILPPRDKGEYIEWHK